MSLKDKAFNLEDRGRVEEHSPCYLGGLVVELSDAEAAVEEARKSDYRLCVAMDEGEQQANIEWIGADSRVGIVIDANPLDSSWFIVTPNGSTYGALTDARTLVSEIKTRLSTVAAPAPTASAELIAESRNNPHYHHCKIIEDLADALERSEREVARLRKEQER